jgi:Glycosyl transferase family 11
MIIVKLQGGLGNQLFQYAACRQLALKNNTLLFFDTTLLEYTKQSDTKRKFELGVYNIRAGVADKALLQKVEKEAAAKNRLRKYFRFLDPCIYNEPHFYFDPLFLKLKKSTIVNGYLQSEKYFKAIENVIRQELVLNRPVSSKTASLKQEIDKTTAVSIHIRRGDYVNNEATQKAHGTCSMEYYQKAVSIIAAKVDNMQLFIFSDDIDWVKNNFHTTHPVTFVGHNDADHAYEDMYLMSCCHHNIIANSSFSWWGAWLNNNTSKIVVAPSKWFNEFDADTKDLLPPEWIKV